MNPMDVPELWPGTLRRSLPDFQFTGAPEQLAGGLMNHVWRVRGQPGSAPASVIVKRTPPHIASAPAVALDPRRFLIEARALAAFEVDGPLAEIAAGGTRPPRLLGLDAERQTLIMEDVCECPDLEAWLRLPDSTSEQAKPLGTPGRGQILPVWGRERLPQA
jgi:hypothetical protein